MQTVFSLVIVDKINTKFLILCFRHRIDAFNLLFATYNYLILLSLNKKIKSKVHSFLGYWLEAALGKFHLRLKLILIECCSFNFYVQFVEVLIRFRITIDGFI